MSHSRKKLRKIVVDGEPYLWCFKNYFDFYSGILVVYCKAYKYGQLEVHYPEDEFWDWSPFGVQIVDLHDPERYLNIHEPETVARVIRYARQHLDWNPQEHKAPLIIEHGFEILKKVGYIAVPRET